MKPKINKHYRLQWEPSSSSFVLLYPEGLVELNDTAAEILQLCDGMQSLDEIVKILEDKYASEEVKTDVITFLKEANERGWLENN